MADFYVTLPSNSQVGNTLSDFRVRLPYTLTLPGDWEVALVELMYPHTWANIDAGTTGAIAVRARLDAASDDLVWYDIDVPTNYYSEPSELIDALNFIVGKSVKTAHGEGTQPRPVEFGYNLILKRVFYEISPDTKELWLSERLLYMMGFDMNRLQTSDHCLRGGCTKGYVSINEGFETREPHDQIADYYPDMTAGTTALYVYCNIVSNQIVGDIMAPLLRVVNIQGENNGQVDQIYQDPHYLPILDREISSIHILIKGDTGHNIMFQSGKVTLKLHFRKRMLAR